MQPPCITVGSSERTAAATMRKPGRSADTWRMPGSDSLKRLGGGRWETRDGRFAIEPQSGTWAVVDNTQTDDLGLPLVRGPYKSLTAAKEAIEEAREAAAPESPLARRLKEAKAAPKAKGTRAKGGAAADAPKEPEPPPEPKWLRDLDPADRRRARELIDRLTEQEVEEAETVARAEVARDQPAVTRIALERRLRRAVAASDDPAEAVRAAIEVILDGRDKGFDVRWRLVDERGRHIDELRLSD